MVCIVDGCSIYESSSRTGGVIHTSERDGYLAEHGPNTLLETSPIIRTLLTELDLGLEQIYSNPEAEKRFLVRNHRLQALPSSLLGWATTPLFSFPAKIRVLGDFLLPRAPSDLEETLAAFDFEISPVLRRSRAPISWPRNSER